MCPSSLVIKRTARESADTGYIISSRYIPLPHPLLHDRWSVNLVGVFAMSQCVGAHVSRYDAMCSISPCSSSSSPRHSPDWLILWLWAASCTLGASMSYRCSHRAAHVVIIALLNRFAPTRNKTSSPTILRCNVMGTELPLKYFPVLLQRVQAMHHIPFAARNGTLG